MGWREDKRWSDRFLPEIKRILGEHLIAEPPMDTGKYFQPHISMI